MGRLARISRALLLSSVAAGAVVNLGSSGRPGVGAVSLGALGVALAVPRLLARWGHALTALAELLWLLPFAACWGLGEGLRMFERVAWWDSVTHALGGLGIVALVLSVLRRRGVPRARSVALALLACAAAGLLWELGEYGSDRFLSTRTQAGASDTRMDLLFDLAGGALGALGAAALGRWAAPRAGVRAPRPAARPVRRVAALLHAPRPRV